MRRQARKLQLLIKTLMFRQDYRINRMMVWKIKNHVDPVIQSENILALCLNNYELINKGKEIGEENGNYTGRVVCKHY
jgi:hypothetical protein